MGRVKKKKDIVIENDRPIWPPLKNQIKGAIRKIFRFSPWMKLTLLKARVEHQKINKDGTVAKRPDVFYKCNSCENLFKANQVEVDHIEPVIPKNKTINDLTYDDIVDRIFCDLSNLQVLCKECHKEKTKREKKEK